MKAPGMICPDGSIQTSDPSVRLIRGYVVVRPDQVGPALWHGWRPAGNMGDGVIVFRGPGGVVVFQQPA